jgi:2-iminobutanoate/2-iminopropanoate deaminase
MKRIVKTSVAPAAIGPYSQAVEINGMLFISGQLGIDPTTGQLVKGGVSEQAQQVLKNINGILEASGYNLSDVVKTTCFLTGMSDFKEMNAVYASVFIENQPARSTVAVKELPLGAMVEIETIAVKERMP